MINPRATSTPQRIFAFLLLVFAVLILYVFLHEFGHGLVVLLSGGRITGFSLLSARIWYENSAGPALTALNHLAGVGLPFLMWLIFILVVPRRANPALELVKVISSVGIINTFLVWIIFPLLALFTTPPIEDSTNFLAATDLPPLLMSGIFLVVYAGGWALFLRKIGGWAAYREAILNLTPLQRPSRRTLLVMGSLAVFSLAAAFALNGFRLDTGRAPRPQPPAGFRLVTAIDLAAAPHQGVPVLTFQVDQPRQGGVFLLLENVKTEWFDARLIGPGGYDQVVLHAEGYYSNVDTAEFTALLEPGEYHLLLTAAASPGTLTVYALDQP